MLAVKYRYLPLLSNAGNSASLIPSVTCVVFFVSSEYTNTALNWLGKTLV